ncbi:hypothetical protein OUZ56_026287 [Daphnia magna]|uniref:Uncharacterized protein n=1 Tax=Daphnia magna TaxID=35525 RepID=A0ABQ9ZMA3_9CRUS|nr:hypothetical protein OUZ56_026287 [Daphnia magna]
MTVLQPIAATFLHETVSMGEDHHHYSRDYPSLLMGILLLITIKPLHPFCLTCLDFFVGLPIVGLVPKLAPLVPRVFSVKKCFCSVDTYSDVVIVLDQSATSHFPIVMCLNYVGRSNQAQF